MPYIILYYINYIYLHITLYYIYYIVVAYHFSDLQYFEMIIHTNNGFTA